MSEKLKEKDRELTAELDIKVLSRLIGYNQTGEPVELVYSREEDHYEWFIGGEYVKDASQQSVERYAEHFNRCPLV